MREGLATMSVATPAARGLVRDAGSPGETGASQLGSVEVDNDGYMTAMRWRGAYNAGIGYSRMDLVVHNSIVYVALAPRGGSYTAVTPGTDTTKWEPFPGSTSSGNATSIRGITISTVAPTGGQILKYNATSSQYEPAADNMGTGGTGGTDSSYVRLEPGAVFTRANGTTVTFVGDGIADDSDAVEQWMERGSSLFNNEGGRKSSGYTDYHGRGMLFASGQAKITRPLKMPITYQFHWVHADHSRARFRWAGDLSGPVFTFDNPWHATFDLFSTFSDNASAEVVKIRSVPIGPRPAQRPLFNRAMLDCNDGEIRRGFVIGGEPFEFTYDANGNVVYTINLDANGNQILTEYPEGSGSFTNKKVIPSSSPFWPGHDNTNEGAAFDHCSVMNPSFCGLEVNYSQCYEVKLYDMRIQGSGSPVWANNARTRYSVYVPAGNVKIRDGWFMNSRTVLYCGAVWQSSSHVIEGPHVEYSERILEQPDFGFQSGQDVILRDIRHTPADQQPADGRVIIHRSGGNLTVDNCHFEYTSAGLADNPLRFDVQSKPGKRYRFQDNKLRLGPSQAVSTLHTAMQPTHGAGTNQRTGDTNAPVGGLF
jgi:hypothetical protein